jgi:hypothetical protein
MPLNVLSQVSRPGFPDFYNYFQHGIDFLITGDTHIVRKIILHTNIVSEVTRKLRLRLLDHPWSSQDLHCFNAISDAHGK